MAIKGRITIDEIELLEVDADPTASGVSAPIGSYAFLWGGNGSWRKIGAADTAWIKIANESLLRYSSLAAYSTNRTTANGVLTLTADSESVQFFTGSVAGQILRLPVATTLHNGWVFEVWNISSEPIVLQYSNGSVLATLGATTYTKISLRNNTTAAGDWHTFGIFTTGTASGVVNYKLVASTPFGTGATSDILIPGFTLTPSSGTYACFYNGASHLTTTPKAHWWSFYKGGVQIADSQRTQDTAHSNQNMVDATMTIATFSGSEAIDVRVRTSKRNSDNKLKNNADHEA